MQWTCTGLDISMVSYRQVRAYLSYPSLMNNWLLVDSWGRTVTVFSNVYWWTQQATMGSSKSMINTNGPKKNSHEHEKRTFRENQEKCGWKKEGIKITTMPYTSTKSPKNKLIEYSFKRKEKLHSRPMSECTILIMPKFYVTEGQISRVYSFWIQ